MTSLYECVRCLKQVERINYPFEIKFGLHDWNFCKKCSDDFWGWAVMSCRYCLKEVTGKNKSKLNKESMICDQCSIEENVEKTPMNKYRIVKDEERAKDKADSTCALASGIGMPLDIIRKCQNNHNLVCEKIYFVEKFVLEFGCASGEWKELSAFKTLEEAKIFLGWLKTNPDCKNEVVHEEEF